MCKGSHNAQPQNNLVFNSKDLKYIYIAQSKIKIKPYCEGYKHDKTNDKMVN